MQRLIVILFFPLFLASYDLIADEDTIRADIKIILTGYWLGTAPDETKVLYEFGDDGSVTWYLDDEKSAQMAPKRLVAKYEIRFGDPYWEIDIFDFEHPQFEEIRFYGIINIIATDEFRMEGSQPPADFRPETFTNESIVFQPASSDARDRITNQGRERREAAPSKRTP